MCVFVLKNIDYRQWRAKHFVLEVEGGGSIFPLRKAKCPRGGGEAQGLGILVTYTDF